MKKLLALVPVVAFVAACGSAPKDTYERRVYEDRQRQDRSAEIGRAHV